MPCIHTMRKMFQIRKSNPIRKSNQNTNIKNILNQPPAPERGQAVLQADRSYANWFSALAQHAARGRTICEKHNSNSCADSKITICGLLFPLAMEKKKQSKSRPPLSRPYSRTAALSVALQRPPGLKEAPRL